MTVLRFYRKEWETASSSFQSSFLMHSCMWANINMHSIICIDAKSWGNKCYYFRRVRTSISTPPPLHENRGMEASNNVMLFFPSKWQCKLGHSNLFRTGDQMSSLRPLPCSAWAYNSELTAALWCMQGNGAAFGYWDSQMHYNETKVAGQKLSSTSLEVAVRTGNQAQNSFPFSLILGSALILLHLLWHMLSAGLQNMPCVGLN